ncbi:ribonuclease P protein component [Patescibacteria group bacterium]|nr:ribonuclease P protein component [Patescibacteria group bacterium]
MLPKKNRLKKNKDFTKVIRQGKFSHSFFLSLKEAKNDLAQTRVGFVVSKKISKKATVRNKIKRWLREAVRANLDKIRSGKDIIFFTKKGIEEKKFWEIKQAVEKLLKKGSL